MFNEKIFFLLCVTKIQCNFKDRDQLNSEMLPRRIHQLMINYNDRGVYKINEITPVRGKYEESPHFELGYVVAEILERYRKMVGHVKRSIQFESDSLFDKIKLGELIQKLFFEIFHLVNMLHEIPRKYSHMREFQEQIPYDRTAAENASIVIEDTKRIREKERKRRIKDMKKERELYMKGELAMRPQKPRKPRNRWWPIDYGWEIDYYW